MLRVSLLTIYGGMLFAQNGVSIYQTHRAACHDAPVGRVPPANALRAMGSTTILNALDKGTMKTQAAVLTERERKAVADYLGRPETAQSDVATGSCGPDKQSPSQTERSAAWSSWGVDASNSRFQGAAAAGLSPAQVPRLKQRRQCGPV